MIPYALLNCVINEEEYRVIDLSVFHIVVRLCERLEKIDTIKVHFYIDSSYQEIELQQYTITEIIDNEFDTEVRIEIQDETYMHLVQDFLKEYQSYIQYKQMDVQELFTNYPMELDSIYPDSYEDFLKEEFRIHSDSCYRNALKNVHLAINLETPWMYQQFMELEWNDFKQSYFESIHLLDHPLYEQEIQTIYVGNQFCSHLYPSLDQLQKMLQKCKQLHKKVVFQFSTMKQHEIKLCQNILDVLKNEDVEIVINDLGMMEMMDFDCSLILGILLNKHTKDTRIQYKRGKKHIQTNSINTSFYASFLKNHGIQRISQESSLYAMKMDAPADVYFPRFQMNTAGYCTMYAKCHNGNRAFQEEVKTCPMYCRNQYFLYPSHLHMIGKYNSLFGYDTRILWDEQYLKEYSAQGNRLVLSV